MERAKKIYDADGQAGSPTEVACKHIGFNGAHGQATAVLSALKKFALVDDKNGRIIPTKLAVDLFNFPPEHPRHNAALVQAALSPDIYGQLYVFYLENGGRLPSDLSLKPELVADKGFNPKVVDGFLADFRGTLEFAGLLSENTLKSIDGTEDGSDSDNVGGGEVTGSAVIDPPLDVVKPPRTHTTQISNPPSQPEVPEITPPGIASERANFDEGPVIITMPDRLSGTSVADFEVWANGIIQRLRRRSGAHKSKMLPSGEQVHLTQHPNKGWFVSSYEWSWLAGMCLQTCRVFAQHMGWEDIEFETPEEAIEFVKDQIASGHAPGKPKK